MSEQAMKRTLVKSQWNPRRSRGASLHVLEVVKVHHRLSGTPAEAGVRGGFGGHTTELCVVSVEPPPKQGCEVVCDKNHRQ